MGYPVVHFEVIGRDGEALRRFYSELFGWEMQTDPELRYGIVSREDNLSPEGDRDRRRDRRGPRRSAGAPHVLRRRP